MNVNLFWEHSVKCEFCDTSFDNQETLKQHLRLHSRRKPYKCDDCGAKFSYNSTLEWHKKSHTGEMPFKCDECGAQFLQDSMLVWHKRKHRVGENSQNSSLVVNVTNIHPQQGIHNLPTIFSLPNLVNTVNSTPVSVMTTSTGGAATTIEVPTPFQMDSMNNPVSVGTVIHPVTSQPEVLPDMMTGKRKPEMEEGTFRCDICGTLLYNGSDLKAHMDNKHNMGENNPFHILAKQQQANGQFMSRKKIIIEKLFKCDLCGAGFNTEGHLRTHRLKHIVERPYKCEKCGLTFSDHTILESHERRHQTERPYKCDRCGAAFFRESHLQRHIKRHTGEFI